MYEGFISYVWQFQYFNKVELKTSEGEKIDVLNPGILNLHAGPDFANAKIRMDGIEWAGSAEIHVASSEWMEHKHHQDPAYDGVVLHVVWKNDKPIYRADNTLLPTLELKDRVDASLIQQYKRLVNTSFAIPCKPVFPAVDILLKRSMFDRALMQRLEGKAGEVIEMVRQRQGDWQETFFILLARNFGFKVNSDPFLQLALSLPCKVLLKHADKPLQVEALLFGQAGFLDVSVGDAYYQLLRREYEVLRQKYNLAEKKLARAQWRFLRLRPANFPTLRLAQFAALIIHHQNLVSEILDSTDLQALRKLFSFTLPAYWQNHYRFNRTAAQKGTDLGASSIDNILINSVVPLLVAYGKQHDRQILIDRAVDILNGLPPESNTITNSWKELGCDAQNAFDSQAFIELFNRFCQKRNCLNCNIGASLLKPKA